MCHYLSLEVVHELLGFREQDTYMTAIFGSLNRSGPNFMTVVSEGLLGYLTITCWLLVQLHVALQVEVTVCLHCCIS